MPDLQGSVSGAATIMLFENSNIDSLIIPESADELEKNAFDHYGKRKRVLDPLGFRTHFLMFVFLDTSFAIMVSTGERDSGKGGK